MSTANLEKIMLVECSIDGSGNVNPAKSRSTGAHACLIPRVPNYGGRERNEAKQEHEHTFGMAQEPIYGVS
jgi:hypothetical protein